jgi:hypothetical protein
MANQTAKNILALYDNTCKQMNDNFVFASQMETDTQSGVVLQNANNVYWKSVEQQAPVISGFDLSGVTPGNIIQQTYPLNVEAPRNDYFSMDAAELRDKTYMENRSMAAARKLNADANQRASNLVTTTGSLYYESGSAGFDFLAEANTIMRERQAYRDMGTSFFLNPRDSQIMSSDLASRTLFPNSRSEEAYAKAMIGERVAGFDRVFDVETFGNIAAAAGGTTTVASDVLEIPQSFITVGGSIQNVDYRFGVINLTSAATFAVGDVITFSTVNAVGLMDKTNTGSLMTFKVIAKDTNALTVYPKPIAANQAGITTSQAAYANISTAIVSGLTASKVNVAGGRANSFWSNDSVCFVNADGNLDVLNEFDGMKVDSQTLDNGVKLYIAYDAKLDSLNCRVRLFTWYGLVNKDPSRNGNAVYVPA